MLKWYRNSFVVYFMYIRKIFCRIDCIIIGLFLMPFCILCKVNCIVLGCQSNDFSTFKFTTNRSGFEITSIDLVILTSMIFLILKTTSIESLGFKFVTYQLGVWNYFNRFIKVLNCNCSMYSIPQRKMWMNLFNYNIQIQLHTKFID